VYNCFDDFILLLSNFADCENSVLPFDKVNGQSPGLAVLWSCSLVFSWPQLQDRQMGWVFVNW